MKKLIFISILLFAGCKVNHDLTGTWKSGGYSVFEKANAILMRHSIAKRNILDLRTDSTWKLQGTCEVIEGSKWKILADSVRLYPDSIWGIHNKSLNQLYTGSPERYFSFKIKKHSLEKHSIGYYKKIDKNGSMINHSINIFEKLEPSK